jgi:hypothetical protein
MVMKYLIPFAGALLVISGVLHLVKPFVYGFNPLIPAVLLALFGAAYIAIGVALLRNRDAFLIYAVVIPLIGLLLTLLGGDVGDTMSQVFIILDILVILISGFLLLGGRGRLGRVR